MRTYLILKDRARRWNEDAGRSPSAPGDHSARRRGRGAGVGIGRTGVLGGAREGSAWEGVRSWSAGRQDTAIRSARPEDDGDSDGGVIECARGGVVRGGWGVDAQRSPPMDLAWGWTERRCAAPRGDTYHRECAVRVVGHGSRGARVVPDTARDGRHSRGPGHASTADPSDGCGRRGRPSEPGRPVWAAGRVVEHASPGPPDPACLRDPVLWSGRAAPPMCMGV